MLLPPINMRQMVTGQVVHNCTIFLCSLDVGNIVLQYIRGGGGGGGAGCGGESRKDAQLPGTGNSRLTNSRGLCRGHHCDHRELDQDQNSTSSQRFFAALVIMWRLRRAPIQVRYNISCLPAAPVLSPVVIVKEENLLAPPGAPRVTWHHLGITWTTLGHYL